MQLLKLSLALISVGSIFLVIPKEMPTEIRIAAAVVSGLCLIFLLPEITDILIYSTRKWAEYTNSLPPGHEGIKNIPGMMLVFLIMGIIIAVAIFTSRK